MVEEIKEIKVTDIDLERQFLSAEKKSLGIFV